MRELFCPIRLILRKYLHFLKERVYQAHERLQVATQLKRV